MDSYYGCFDQDAPYIDLDSLQAESSMHDDVWRPY